MNNNNDTVFHSSNGGINTNNNVNSNISYNYNYLSAWGYFGYKILFSIPLIGFIFLIIYSFDNNNINRRNFARSYWCTVLIVLILIILALSILLILFGKETIDFILNIKNSVKLG